MAAAIWTLITMLPEFFSLGKSLIAFLTKFETAREAAAHLKDFHAATIVAQKTGDTSGLEKLFNGGDTPAIPAGSQQLPNQPANT
jgi:hypothetical protein